MQNQLIMFAGSSPGAGKSTLSALLLQHLVADSRPTQWFYEEDIVTIKAFTSFLHDLTTSYPKTDLFLKAATAFVQEATALNKIVITDSFLPGYGFFSAATHVRRSKHSTASCMTFSSRSIHWSSTSTVM